MSKQNSVSSLTYPKTLLLGLQTPFNEISNIDSYYEEFLKLVKTNGVPYETLHTEKLRVIDPAYFLTKGKRFDLKKICQDLEIQHIIISETISNQQRRNLQKFLECKIFDRTDLILDIFEKSAHSAEGKTQVAIARLEHKKTMLAGKGVGLAQQKGGLAMRGGFGETAKEKETRDIEKNILWLKNQLKKIQNTREVQRKKRIKNKVPHICLVGYTNAGKSTLLNTLTNSNVLAEDKLFATLDTTTRELYVDGAKVGIISDTVGFIQNLPPKLIAAFKSTLSELQYADILFLVTDISDPNWQSHINTVLQILQSIKVVDKEILYVFNKGDLLEEENYNKLVGELSNYHPYVLISAKSRQTLEPLYNFLLDWKFEKEFGNSDQ